MFFCVFFFSVVMIVRILVVFLNVIEWVYKYGDIIFGGLFLFYFVNKNGLCISFCLNVLMYFEVMVFMVEEINKKDFILCNIIFGYDICDMCGID